MVLGFHKDVLLIEEGACLARGQNALDDEGVELSVCLVVGSLADDPPRAPGSMVAPELELAGFRHGVAQCRRDHTSSALGAVIWEGLHHTEVATIGQPEPVELGDRPRVPSLWRLARP